MGVGVHYSDGGKWHAWEEAESTDSGIELRAQSNGEQ